MMTPKVRAALIVFVTWAGGSVLLAILFQGPLASWARIERDLAYAAVFALGVGLAWLDRRGPSTTRAAPRTKTCPKCAEDVKFAALVCRFCGNEFAEAPVVPGAPESEPVALVGTGNGAGWNSELAGRVVFLAGIASLVAVLGTFALPRLGERPCLVGHSCVVDSLGKLTAIDGQPCPNQVTIESRSLDNRVVFLRPCDVASVSLTSGGMWLDSEYFVPVQ